ncbi:hypothetical protein BJ742DRAFT_734827 [Cladochytrium replicatum]|nr:hypothetical protein BJ742DRAFT_734827 [Cladochytrium replicatum]
MFNGCAAFPAVDVKATLEVYDRSGWYNGPLRNHGTISASLHIIAVSASAYGHYSKYHSFVTSSIMDGEHPNIKYWANEFLLTVQTRTTTREKSLCFRLSTSKEHLELLRLGNEKVPLDANVPFNDSNSTVSLKHIFEPLYACMQQRIFCAFLVLHVMLLYGQIFAQVLHSVYEHSLLGTHGGMSQDQGSRAQLPNRSTPLRCGTVYVL